MDKPNNFDIKPPEQNRAWTKSKHQSAVFRIDL